MFTCTCLTKSFPRRRSVETSKRRLRRPAENVTSTLTFRSHSLSTLTLNLEKLSAVLTIHLLFLRIHPIPSCISYARLVHITPSTPHPYQSTTRMLSNARCLLTLLTQTSTAATRPTHPSNLILDSRRASHLHQLLYAQATFVCSSTRDTSLLQHVSLPFSVDST